MRGGKNVQEGQDPRRLKNWGVEKKTRNGPLFLLKSNIRKRVEKES